MNHERDSRGERAEKKSRTKDQVENIALRAGPARVGVTDRCHRYGLTRFPKHVVQIDRECQDVNIRGRRAARSAIAIAPAEYPFQ
ncbi:hypothetical protein EVAR_52858_1 [Eumeta japonica]|uniref:Uncharacterized protein n=1 Tax=Eumeta variegata TaxID=151549 RepID=A0A4C1YER0_EUMVA|nr:hypothetical protein EVAR_52858_1 [Eumeta japonica]